MTGRGAEIVAVIATVVFAVLIWWYVLNEYSQTTGLIVTGVAVIILDLLALWSLSKKKSIKNNKKGKK